MEYATCPSSVPPAASRAQRIAKVKFVALVLEPEPAPAVATLSSSPARLYHCVRAALIRVFERLVAARP